MLFLLLWSMDDKAEAEPKNYSRQVLSTIELPLKPSGTFVYS